MLMLADGKEECVSFPVLSLPFFKLRQRIEVRGWVTLIKRLHRLTRQEKGRASLAGCN